MPSPRIGHLASVKIGHLADATAGRIWYTESSGSPRRGRGLARYPTADSSVFRHSVSGIEPSG
jgi:hypothetical protein